MTLLLGADWIFTHSPIGLNLKTREFSKIVPLLSPLWMKLFYQSISLLALRSCVSYYKEEWYLM